MTESEDRDRYIVPALERGLGLLRGFTHGVPAMSLGKISKANELPRATVFRLIRTLEMLGYLRRIDGTKIYRLGPAVLVSVLSISPQSIYLKSPDRRSKDCVTAPGHPLISRFEIETRLPMLP